MKISTSYDKKALNEFLQSHSKSHFMQSFEWTKVKSNWKNEFVVAYDNNNKIIGAMLVLIRKMPMFNYSLMYSPRGPVCDIYNLEVMQGLLNKVKELAKQYKAYTLKVDTDVLSSDEKFAEIVTLITMSPQSFKGGEIWNVIVNIHGALQAIGYGLLVLFFIVGVIKTCGSFAEVKKPEHALKLFIRFAIAKIVITHGLELIIKLVEISQGIIAKILSASGLVLSSSATLPESLITTIETCGFFESIPLWAVTLIGSLFITALAFIMILSVYGRFFKIYMYAAIAPIPLSTFAGETTQSVGKQFLKSFCAVLLEGAVIVLACIIFSVFASSPPVVDTSLAAVTQVWAYIGELIFNMLVLVGSVKMADRIIREMMGL